MTTFALVHGGNYTSDAWERLVPHLDGDVVLVELPGRGRRPGDPSRVTLADNVAATIEDLEPAGATDVVLVGHSIGGITVAHVLNEVPDRIALAVLVSCTIPPHGSAVIDHIDPDVRDSVMAGSGGGVFRIDEETVLDFLCNDLDDEQTAWALEHMVAETTSILSEVVDLSGLRSGVPVTYVRLGSDRTLPPEQQDAAIAAVGSPEVVVIDAGHMVMLSRPEELAAVLNERAARPARRAR
ncbi:MAG TPA: alpha/beta fold hydrolase [Acidimicrobiales bacterium]|nr:alpha/beta fold hydrolase [Acidimicrobiales bacterium]